MICVTIPTDGRVDCLAQTIASMGQQVTGDIGHRFIWDDTGSYDHYRYLLATHPEWTVLRSPNGRQGFGGAIRSAWSRVRSSGASHHFWCEDDFVFERPVDLDVIAWLLDKRPYLAQMALRRQPWNAAEIEAGGVVELHPDAYVDRYRGGPGRYLSQWLEHRLFWTTNPSLFRADVLAVGWPEAEHSEGVFTHRLLDGGFGDEPADEVRFGYWGNRQSKPWVRHIGETRVGCGY